MKGKRNPFAKAVTRLKPKIVRPKKGRGSKQNKLDKSSLSE